MAYNYIWDCVRNKDTNLSGKWLVYATGNFVPSVFHDTYEEAKNEAIRLHKKCGGTFQILKIESIFINQLVKHGTYSTQFSKEADTVEFD